MPELCIQNFSSHSPYLANVLQEYLQHMASAKEGLMANMAGEVSLWHCKSATS